MKRLLLGSLLLLPAGPAPAQARYHVSPGACAQAEGNSHTNLPFLYGLSSTRWGPLQLPFGLGFLGGRGNSIYTDMLVLQVAKGATTPEGHYNWRQEGVPVPYDPVLSPLDFFMQAASTDLANPTSPLVFTGACAMKLDFRPVQPLCRLFSSNGSAAAMGTYDPGYGLVTRFEYD